MNIQLHLYPLDRFPSFVGKYELAGFQSDSYYIHSFMSGFHTIYFFITLEPETSAQCSSGKEYNTLTGACAGMFIYQSLVKGDNFPTHVTNKPIDTIF